MSLLPRSPAPVSRSIPALVGCGFLLCAAMTSPRSLLAQATPTMPPRVVVYVSAVSEQKITRFELDETREQLLDPVAFDVAGAPGALAPHPTRRFLYASLRSNSSLAAYQIDPRNGHLSRVNEAALGAGENAAHLAVDATGRWLVSASYAAGKVVVHELQDDGAIRSPARQTLSTAKTAHFVGFSPDQKFVFVPHVAPNAIHQFRFDAKTGEMTPAGEAAGGAPGAGPRHLAFHPSGKWAFSSDESGSSVTVYRYDPERGLVPIQTSSTLPANYQQKNSTAEVKVHPSGRFAWVSNRGHDSLAGFSFDATSERVTPLGQTPTEATPRSFDLAPSGRFAFGAGEGSGKLAFFRLDPDTGKLSRRATYEVGRSLTWVLALEIPASPPRPN